MQTPESQSPPPALALAWENLAPWFGCSQGRYTEHTLVLTHGIAGGLCWPRCSNGPRGPALLGEAPEGHTHRQGPGQRSCLSQAAFCSLARKRLASGTRFQAQFSSTCRGSGYCCTPQDSLTPSRGKLTATAHSSLFLVAASSRAPGTCSLLPSPPVKPAGLGGPGSFSPSPQGSSPTHPGAWCQHPQGFKAARRHPSPGCGVRCCRRMERQWEMGYAVSARSRAAPQASYREHPCQAVAPSSAQPAACNPSPTSTREQQGRS